MAEKTAEQLKAEQDALVEAFSTKMGVMIAPLTEKVNALDTRWTELERKAEAATNEEVNANKTDEEKTKERMDATLAHSIMTNARITEMEVMQLPKNQQFADLFPKVKEVLAQIPVQSKGLPTYAQMVQNVIEIQIANEARTSGLRRDPDTKKFLLEDSLSTTSTKDNSLSDFTWQDPKNPSKILTGEQQLAKLGINPDDFIKSQKDGRI